MSKGFLRFADRDFIRNLPETKGIYFLVSLDQDNRPRAVQRLLGLDKTGVLYVGRAKNLRRRLAALRKCILPEFDGEGHVAGNRYNRIKRLKNKYRPQTLAIKFTLYEDYEKLETVILMDIEQTYGDLPPLNRNIRQD